MQFYLTLTLLLLGSVFTVFRIREEWASWREHIGLVILLYSFIYFILFIISGFLLLLREQTFFALLKTGLWISMMCIGFVLAYPILERNLMRGNRELTEHGRRVFEGFEGSRRLLGSFGFLLSAVLVLLQLGWL